MKLLSFAGCAVLLLGACTVDEDATEQEDEYVDPGVQTGDGKTDAASSVESVSHATCSTVPVRGLSMQIAEEIRCLAPGLLVPFNETSAIHFSTSAVLPYLEATTASALGRAATNLGSLTVNSGLRSLAQQFLLRRWREQGRCGIVAAAPPGRSNHETGRAVDLANHAAAMSAMAGRGFTHLSYDPVHFDHLSSPDLRDVGVQAFQHLWNLNHPDDTIAEDGSYGSDTAARLARSPAGGFSKGPSCDPM